MKNYLYILFPFLLLSCEDVIEVDLNTAPPKLVIDASLNWFKNTLGNEQEIKLTLSAPYFEDAVTPASGAQVVVTKNGNWTTTRPGQETAYAKRVIRPPCRTLS